MTRLTEGSLHTVKILVGFGALWVVLDRTAVLLGSYRGEAGIAVCAVVLACAVVLEWVLFKVPPRQALAALGLGRPGVAGLAAAAILSAVLLLFFPAWSAATGTRLVVRGDWYLLLPGIAAQAGIAEETVFRGFLFRHFREHAGFWWAAVSAALPFIAVHLLLFASLDPVLAAVSIALSVSIAFPLAWLFERSGNAVWPPAIVHAVVQGAIKLVEAPGGGFEAMAVAWIVLTAAAPWALFLLRPRRA